MIIVNNAFVYIHHPKTGGTFVTEMLRKIASDSKEITIQELPGLKHAGVNKIPEKFRHLQIVTNVRDVFEHYVSRYTFRWWADPVHFKKTFIADKVINDYPGFPELTFFEFLRFFNQWSFRCSMTEKKAEMLSTHNIGFNSWALTRLCIVKPLKLFQEFDDLDEEILKNKFQEIRFLRTENLNSDLYELLKDYGANENKIRPVLDAQPILPKKGGRGKQKKTWDDYFSQEDISFVKERDRLYFRLFPDMLPSLKD